MQTILQQPMAWVINGNHEAITKLDIAILYHLCYNDIVAKYSIFILDDGEALHR